MLVNESIQLSPPVRITPLGQNGATDRWRNEAMRSHANARLIHISRGQGRISIAGLTAGYGPNNIIYIPPNTIYGMEVGPSVSGQTLALSRSAPWFSEPMHLRLTETDRQKEALGLIESIERELLPTGEPRAASCYMELLHIFLERQIARGAADSTLARRKTASARLVARYAALIARDFASHRNVGAFAEELGVTPTHLTRACRSTSGKSALTLLNERVHFEACTLLRDTKKPVKEIAARLGFGSAAYFTRQFQRMSGASPTAFRAAGV